MAHKVIRTESCNGEKVATVLIGEFNTNEEADEAICNDVSDFREHHDNDERIDWNRVDVFDSIGNCNSFVWSIDEAV